MRGMIRGLPLLHHFGSDICQLRGLFCTSTKLPLWLGWSLRCIAVNIDLNSREIGQLFGYEAWFFTANEYHLQC